MVEIVEGVGRAVELVGTDAARLNPGLVGSTPSNVTTFKA